MSRIRKENTRPEMLLRRALFALGARGHRVHTSLPGRPDIVFSRPRVAVFVDGCFWHGCRKCAIPLPRSNRSYWLPKLAKNAARDRQVSKRLRREGWAVARLWEHEVFADAPACAQKVMATWSATHPLQNEGREEGLAWQIGLCRPQIATKWWRRRELNPRPKARRRRTLHAYPLLLSRAQRVKAAKNRQVARPGLSHPRAPSRHSRASLLNDIRPPTTRRGQGERSQRIRLRERTEYPQLTDVPSDLRVNGARHASRDLAPPSKPIRPHRG